MRIFDNLSLQTKSDKPNEDWTHGEAKYIVDDYSPLAQKILECTQFEPVENDEGELIDVIPKEEIIPEAGGDILEQ